MKCLILHVLELLQYLINPPDHFKDLHQLKLLTNVVVNLTSSRGGGGRGEGGGGRGESSELKVEHSIRYPFWSCTKIDIKICQDLQFMEVVKIIREFFFIWSRSSKNVQNVVFRDKL